MRAVRSALLYYPYLSTMRTSCVVTFALLAASVACGTPAPKGPPPAVRNTIAARPTAPAHPDEFSPVIDSGRVLGDSTAKVWIVMVSDFQCGDCKTWNDEVLPIIRERFVDSKRARFAFINMPLPRHANAMASAVAAACASAQRKFWGTSARIFATQNKWKNLPDARPFLDSLAIASGADTTAQRSCTEHGRSTKLVMTDIDRSKAAAVDSLPTFFVGSHRMVGVVGPKRFSAVIDSALAGK